MTRRNLELVKDVAMGALLVVLGLLAALAAVGLIEEIGK